MGLPNFALVAQLEKAAVSKTVCCGYPSLRDATRTGSRLKGRLRFPSRVSKLAPVAQLEEVADLKSVCCGFDSHQEYQRDVIQWREAMLWEHGVAGSSPAIPICRCDGAGIRAGIRVRILQVQFLLPA